MRDKLAKLINDIIDGMDELAEVPVIDAESLLKKLESILATEPPAVTVRAGWVCKDNEGLLWFNDKPVWSSYCGWGGTSRTPLHYADAECITDPWPDKPNGGPECCMEVK